MGNTQGMTNIIDLGEARRRLRRSYLTENGSRLGKFVSSFVSTHFKTDFDAISSIYMQSKIADSELVWDFHDLRDDVRDAICKVYGDLVWSEINKERWFNRTYLSYDDIIERCTTELILGGQCAVQIK